jgi:acetolactate decarboxylase
MKIFFAIVLTALVSLQSCKQDTNSAIEGIEYAGSLQDIMNGKLDSNIRLSELKDVPNLYALGAMAGLKGEIQIFNSQPYNSRVTTELLELDKNFNANAALLVYTQVPEWQEFSIPKAILTLKQFEDYLEYTAVKAGMDTSKPFPFLIDGYVRKINWHIVDWDENNAEHSREAHIQSGLNGVVVEEDVEILGFYSKDHKGVYTHHDSNWHMHFFARNQKVAGHLDNLLLGEYMTLKLPKTQ